jgi:hypothetical protein
MKSVINEGHFTLAAGTVFLYYFACECSGVTQTRHVSLPQNAPQPTPVWPKLRISEGHFSLDAGTVFHPYLALFCSGVTQT